MKPKKRQKLCHNCEGEIDVDVIVCPFCAADLREEKPELMRSSSSASVSRAFGGGSPSPSLSLYPPPYTPKIQVPDPIPEEDPPVQHEQADQLETSSTNPFVATVSFTLGVQLFLLGLLMLFFSHKGMVVLKWDATYWFLYCLFGIPLLYFGYKAVSKL